MKTKILKYKLSGDEKGLLAYFSKNNFYHIHSNELTLKEKFILRGIKNENK